MSHDRRKPDSEISRYTPLSENVIADQKRAMKWFAAHEQELYDEHPEYRGQHVAIHPEGRVIGYGTYRRAQDMACAELGDPVRAYIQVVGINEHLSPKTRTARVPNVRIKSYAG